MAYKKIKNIGKYYGKVEASEVVEALGAEKMVLQDWMKDITKDAEKYFLENFATWAKRFGYTVSVAKRYSPGQPDKIVIELWKE